MRRTGVSCDSVEYCYKVAAAAWLFSPLALCLCVLVLLLLLLLLLVLLLVVTVALLVLLCCSHSLLDGKINSVLSLCHDQATLNAVQRIIQNTIVFEDASPQQLSYLQSKYRYTTTTPTPYAS